MRRNLPAGEARTESMDSTELSNLIGRLERQSDRAPQVYLTRVALVAALGYLPVALIAAPTLAALYIAIASLLSHGRPYMLSLIGVVAGGAILAAIVRALQVHVDEPPGREILPEDAPALFAAIDEVIQKMTLVRPGARKARAVTIEAVTLNREFNAGIREIPRWGVFGHYRSYLQIGMPLLAALNIAEFKAVLAHETGHQIGLMDRTQDRFSAYIYRQRTIWQLLVQKLEKPNGVTEQILAGFYEWYAPYFSAYTLALTRNHELAADRSAARATHPRVLGRALTKIELVARFLGEIFWKRLFDQVEKVPEPRYLPYTMLPRALDVAQKEWLRRDWLLNSLHTFARDDDTHPSLADRLAALDVPNELPSHAADASALALLSTNQQSLLKWCDDEWLKENGTAWRKKHDAIREARWKLSQYENMPAGELQAEALWEKSVLLLELGQDHEVIETLRELVAHDDVPAKAHLQLGKMLLEYGDEQGLKNLAAAGQQDSNLLEIAGQIGYGYLMDRGRRGEAQRFWERLRDS
jgi:hypothetical protein